MRATSTPGKNGKGNEGEKEGKRCKGREKTPPPRNKCLFAALSTYFVLHVVGGQFTEHVVSQTIHNTLSRLAAAAARVFRLNTDNGRQHLVHHVRLITATQSYNDRQLTVLNEMK